MSDLTRHLIKLGNANPELRPHLKKVLTHLTQGRGVQASRSPQEWGKRVRELVRSAPQLAEDVLSRNAGSKHIVYDYPFIKGLMLSAPNEVKVSGNRVLYSSKVVSKPLTSTVWDRYDEKRGSVENIFGPILSEKKVHVKVKASTLRGKDVEAVYVTCDLPKGAFWRDFFPKVFKWEDRINGHVLWSAALRGDSLSLMLDEATFPDETAVEEFLAGLNCPGAKASKRWVKFDWRACL